MFKHWCAMSVQHHLPIVGVVIDGLDTYVWEKPNG